LPSRAAICWLLVASVGAFSADEPLAPDDVAFFETNVRPLLVARCYECHAGNESNGGLLLDTRDALLQGGDSGPAIVPRQPEESRLIDAVRYKNPNLQMPPQNPLSDREIAILGEWVARGAPDPRTSVTPAVPAGPVGMSIEEGRSFWSFQPATRPPLPTIDRLEACRTWIDVFLQHRLEAKQIDLAPPADRLTLIRRVHFDIVGLPPSPVEIDDFLDDRHPDAFERVVDKLLASPAYAVRWGRHWLDVARYADSNGLDENLALGNAWRYRDYVVDAVNTDKPFDRFLVEQIAGDLLPDASAETRTATGFLVLGAKVLAEPDREKLTMDTIDEQLDAMGKAFWGMTIGCVRCHDHKFDPIKQTDYYALAAIFKSTKTFGDTNTGAIKHWHEYSMADPMELEHLKEVDAKITRAKEAMNAFKAQATDKIRAEARQRVVDYLVAGVDLAPSASLAQVEAVARPTGLHPRILYHARQHLEFHRDDPLYQLWHRFSRQGDSGAVRDHYGNLFQRLQVTLSEVTTRPLPDADLESARIALDDPTGLINVPPKPEFAFDPATLAEYHRLAEEARLIESQSPDEPAAMGVRDDLILTSLQIHIRGSHHNLGPAVPRRFPEVMTTPDATTSLPPDKSGRLELARWMASPEHPLTSRVWVNRLWRWHFGRGIVASTDNFGIQGSRPSHPQLLDALAAELVAQAWSSRSLHRLILSSAVYRASSTHPDPTIADKDADNELLARFPRRRLDAEQIRDAILAVAGRLDLTIGGKTVPLRNRQFVFDHTSIDHTNYDSLRRALYLPVIRNNVYTLFEQFDFPDPTMPTGHRHTTIVPSQALFLLNAELVLDAADDLAEDLLREEHEPSHRLTLAYRRSLGRHPTPAEQERDLSFITKAQTTGSLSEEPSTILSEKQAWALWCQTLLARNEFLDVR
jgi:hypothetical protein